MSTNALMLQLQKKQTNHVLHLLLSLLTFGIWIIIWILCAIETNSHNKAIDRKIIAVMAEDSRGSLPSFAPQSQPRGRA